uniref:Uncharacterized protein n=1 Tax=Romanomermis culicivorax TaxID=13658 RepID=A0A915J6H5_ROMCU
MEQEKPIVVIIADPPIASTPADGSIGVEEEEKLMEIVESERETQPDLEKLTEQYGKAAIELAKQLEDINPEEEGMSEEPYLEVVSEIGSDDEETGGNILPTPRVYAKAGEQNVENITNLEKFTKAMQKKRQAKEKRIVREENEAELDKVKSGKFQQPTKNPNDKIKYRRGLGKRGQVLNKALKEGKYIIDFQYGRVSVSNLCVQKYLAHIDPTLAHIDPTLDEEVALMTTELINWLYDEAGIEIETIRYYQLKFHVLQANLPKKLWSIFELQLAQWSTTRSPEKAYEAAIISETLFDDGQIPSRLPILTNPMVLDYVPLQEEVKDEDLPKLETNDEQEQVMRITEMKYLSKGTMPEKIF